MAIRVLCVYKKSQLALYEEHEPDALVRLRCDEPQIHDRLLEAHTQNADAIAVVEAAIRARTDIDATFAYRAEVEPTTDFDLVISVGGDGTLLDVSHSLFVPPLLGINSSPGLSVGNFCVSGPEGCGKAIDAWRAGTLREVPLTRIQVRLNDKAVNTPVLNEVLFAHTVPAAMSRYVMTLGDRTEEQKSSGIWISTAAGSTAAIRSAGGMAMLPEDTRLQYRVREPYQAPGQQYVLMSGLVSDRIEILSKMRTSAIYLDGYREQIELSVGDRVTIGAHPNPLKLVGFRQTLA